MEWRRSKRVLFGLLLLLLPFLSSEGKADPTPTSIDRQAWEKAKERLDYSEIDEQEEIKKLSQLPDFRAVGGIVQIVLIVLAVGGLVFLLIWLLKDWKALGNKKVGDRFSVSDFLSSEGERQELVIDDEVNEAINKKDYKRAVRLLYLQLIISLGQNGLITWRKEKTNNDYYFELQTKENVSNEFLFLTRVYEMVWFGEKTTDETEFTEIHTRFLAIKSMISEK